MRKPNLFEVLSCEKGVTKIICFLMVLGLVIPQMWIGGVSASDVEAEMPVNRKTETVKQFKETRREALMGGYFRTWHDKYSTDENGEPHRIPSEANSMGDVPSEVDFLFVFHDWTAPNSIFWEKLRDEYVPKLNAQGTKVIRTIGAGFLTGEVGISKDKEKYPDTEEGYKKLAADIVEEYVYKHNLDGLDVDVEIHNEPGHSKQGEEKAAEMKKAITVMKEIAKLIGENGKDNTRFLILDTTLHAGRRIRGGKDVGPNNEFFTETHKCYDYVLAQVYGAGGEKGDFSKDMKWKTFQPYIKPNQFLIGFSFYEEGGRAANNIWGDTLGTPTDSRASRYAHWNPEGGIKGGIFSYAIERDGAREFRRGRRLDGDNTLRTTTYEWTKSLKQQMKSYDAEYMAISEDDFPDPVLREEIAKQIGNYRGNISRYNQELILDNPHISDLTGLDKLINVKAIHFHNLVELRNLNLKGLRLESLPLDAVNWTQVEKVDVSDNQLDLSPNTDNRKVLEAVLTNLEKNVDRITIGENAIYNNQRPKGYYPNHYEYKYSKVVYEKSDETADVSMYLILEGQKTEENTYIWDESEFDAFKKQLIREVEFVAPDYSYADFQVAYGENYAFAEVLNSDGETVENTTELPLNQDAEYRIVFHKKVEIGTDTYTKGEKIHEILIVVGNGAGKEENLAYKATMLGHNFKVGPNHIPNPDLFATVFDGVIHTANRLKGVALPNSWLVFDIGEGKTANGWKFVNDSFVIAQYPNSGREMFNLKKATLEYLKNEDGADIENHDYQANDENWVLASGFENGETEKTIQKEFDAPINARYWRFKLVEPNQFGAFSIPEIMILGNLAHPKALVSDMVLNGFVNRKMTDNRIEIVLQGDEFIGLQNGDDISAWFKPEQNGLAFYVANSSADNKVLRVVAKGAPQEEFVGEMQIVIPADKLSRTNSDLAVSNALSLNINLLEPEIIAAGENKEIRGFVSKEINDSFEIALQGSYFELIYDDMDITHWISPKVENIKYHARVKEDRKLEVKVSGISDKLRNTTRLSITIPSYFMKNARKDVEVNANTMLSIEYPPVLLPYQPNTNSSSNSGEIVIENESIAQSSAEKSLVEEMTKNLSAEQDKELVKQFFAKKISAKQFVEKLSEKAYMEYAKSGMISFKDVNLMQWYAKELTALHMLRLVEGYEDNTFRPNNRVSGKELVTLLVRAGGLPLVEVKTQNQDWFAPYKEAAEKAGLLKQVEFSLDKELNREEVALLSYNFVNRNSKEELQAKNVQNITDKEKVSAQYEKAVSYLYEAEVLKGYEDGTFRPMNAVKRSEVVAILYRLLKVK